MERTAKTKAWMWVGGRKEHHVIRGQGVRLEKREEDQAGHGEEFTFYSTVSENREVTRISCKDYCGCCAQNRLQGTLRGAWRLIRRYLQKRLRDGGLCRGGGSRDREK